MVRVDRTVLMGRRLRQQAERDLESAKMIFQPRGYYVAAYCAHQAAEKAIKAAHWHLRGEEPPWNHSLSDIAERVAEVAGTLPSVVDKAVVRLEPLFEETRYPSGDIGDPIPADLIDEQEAKIAIANAEEVLGWVRALMQRPPKKGPRKIP